MYAHIYIYMYTYAFTRRYMCIYTCMHIYIYMAVPHVFSSCNIHRHSQHTNFVNCICAPVMHECMHARTHARTHTRTRARIKEGTQHVRGRDLGPGLEGFSQLSSPQHICAYIHVHKCIYICMCLHRYTCIYTYI